MFVLVRDNSNFISYHISGTLKNEVQVTFNIHITAAQSIRVIIVLIDLKLLKLEI